MPLRIRLDGAINFTHKNGCHDFEAKNGGGSWFEMELECLPIDVGRNLRPNWRAARILASYVASPE